MWTYSCTINKITSKSICKHPNNDSAFFIKGEAKLTKSVLLAFEVIIMAHHSYPNAVEHMSYHREAVPEIFGWICWLCAMEVILQ